MCLWRQWYQHRILLKHLLNKSFIYFQFKTTCHFVTQHLISIAWGFSGWSSCYKMKIRDCNEAMGLLFKNSEHFFFLHSETEWHCKELKVFALFSISSFKHGWFCRVKSKPSLVRFSFGSALIKMLWMGKMAQWRQAKFLLCSLPKGNILGRFAM